MGKKLSDKLKDYPRLKKFYIAYIVLFTFLIVIPISLLFGWGLYFGLHATTSSFKTFTNFIIMCVITAFLTIIFIIVFIVMRIIVKKSFLKIYRVTQSQRVYNTAKFYLGEKILQSDIEMANEYFEKNNKNIRL
ncbi:hypothetical protein [Mycoplasmopsis arginini]|uniref:hypothetical protein n=1 Tax=Mycoplasmopsis arginini TaxID=2094 RepID=UPI002734F3B2|nr:hypothetical protein [Mycoplasmopsis arginini]MDP4042663.1 hypothetical protein [Mycoplasmopsis arginini]